LKQDTDPLAVLRDTKSEQAIMIKIIDYHMGNMFSVQGACSEVGLAAAITSDKNEIMLADALILPGVGAFGEAMNNLQKLDLIEPIKDFIFSGKPFLGICLGMQLLFSESEEFGINKGLGVIEGRVTKFPKKNSRNLTIRVPHIGWNSILEPAGRNASAWECAILKGIDEGEYMYFVHSFYGIPSDEKVIISVTDYDGIPFCSSLHHGNIYATQFHPEKSAKKGIQIYHNWKNIIQEVKENML
jgi:glutamine amidotransferase